MVRYLDKIEDETKIEDINYIKEKSEENHNRIAKTSICFVDETEEIIEKCKFNGLPYFMNEDQYYKMATLHLHSSRPIGL